MSIWRVSHMADMSHCYYDHVYVYDTSALRSALSYKTTKAMKGQTNISSGQCVILIVQGLLGHLKRKHWTPYSWVDILVTILCGISSFARLCHPITYALLVKVHIRVLWNCIHRGRGSFYHPSLLYVTLCSLVPSQSAHLVFC